MKAIDFTDNLNQFLEEYHYQPNLTKKLDNIGKTSLTQEMLNEIVLWKVNRYVSLSVQLVDQLDKLINLNYGEHNKAESALISLLNTKGIDLPMASTFMRFRNPRVFQIIDKHAYRAVTDKKYPLYSNSSNDKKIRLYFDYLDLVIELCKKRGLKFETIDRLLYIFDKCKNGKL